MLVTLYFIIMLILFWKIRKENTIRRWVLGLYCFSALCSVLYPWFIPIGYEQNGVAYVYYIICTLILLYPIWYFGKVNCTDFEFPEFFIKWLSRILIFFGFISLINILPQVFTLRTFLNNISEVRLAYYQGEELTSTNTSLMNVLANWVMYIQFLAPGFVFLNYINGHKIRTLLLCIVSLTPALSKLTIGEREASVVVVANFIFAYIFFRPILSDTFAQKIKRVGIFLTIPLLLFVVAMTISRFGEAEGGIWGGLLVYIGEQPFNFSYMFSNINIEQQCLGGKLSFGYLFPESEQLVGQINDFISAGEYLNVFAGIPGTLLLDFSYTAIFVILLIVLFFVIIFRRQRNKKVEKYDFSTYMLLLIYYQIIFMGIFYFDFNSKYVVYMCALLFIAYFITSKILKKKKAMHF